MDFKDCRCDVVVQRGSVGESEETVEELIEGSSEVDMRLESALAIPQ
jgi:hypothetical protein